MQDAYVLDDHVGFLLRLAGQRHLAIFAEHMPEQLTATQFAALAKINEIGPCSQNRLGRLTAMDVATIKGVVDRLTARGLTRAEPDPQDGRMLLIFADPGRPLHRRTRRCRRRRDHPPHPGPARPGGPGHTAGVAAQAQRMR